MQGSWNAKWNTCVIILHTHNLIILIPCWQCFAYVKAPTFVFRDKSTKGPTEKFQKDRLSCLSFYFHLPNILPSCLCARGKRISPSPCSFPISSGTPRIRVITPPCGTNFISRSYESVVWRALLDYTVCVCCKHVAYLPNVGHFKARTYSSVEQQQYVPSLLIRSFVQSVQNNLNCSWKWTVQKICRIAWST